MKIAKKIFVGTLAVAMLVSCFALFASAEATERPVENFNSVLEYLTKATYLTENYEEQEIGADYTLTSPHFTFEKNDKVSATVAGGADGKYLSVLNNPVLSSEEPVLPAGYKLYTEDKGYGELVTSFEFKTGDANGTNGADVVVKATFGDYFDDIILFAANTSDDAKKEFIYSEYDYDRAIYNTVKAEAVPELGVWYHVELVLAPDAEIYRVRITKGDELVLDFKDTIDKSKTNIDSMRIYVSNPQESATTTCFDNVAVYEGTAARDVINHDETLAQLALKIDQYANDELTPIEDKVEVAEFYKEFYLGENPYVAPDEAENKAQLDEIKNGAQEYINKTYLAALVAYSEAVKDIEGYYAKIAYLGDEENESVVRSFYNYFAGEDASAFVGLTKDEIDTALKAYDEKCAELEKIGNYCQAFVKTIERNYDPKNNDFGYMQLKYAALSTLVDKVEEALEYKYSDDPEAEYKTAADAYVVYKALEEKIAAIAKNASEIFIPAVSAMDDTQVESVSKDAPFLTVNFESLYSNYLVASSVYANGTVYEGLDPATYPGLADAISEYLAYGEYIEQRIADCTDFIDSIRAAEVSTYYKTIRDKLANAAEYFDENKEKALEKYAGVEDAIAIYDSLVLALEKSEQAADAYIAAVNAININASYAELRTAVTNARALKASGSLIGYEGVAEADTKFAKADAKLSVLEGHSSTLLYAVEALKTASTLAERRELIFIGLGAKDGSEENISGVTAAKAELASQIQKYNDDVARVNALFAGVVGNTSSSISSVAPTDGVIISAEVIEALLK